MATQITETKPTAFLTGEINSLKEKLFIYEDITRQINEKILDIKRFPNEVENRTAGTPEKATSCEGVRVLYDDFLEIRERFNTVNLQLETALLRLREIV